MNFADNTWQALSPGSWRVEAQFAKGEGAICIAFAKEGKPDQENYTALVIEHKNELPFIRVSDCQNGIRDVRDCTDKIPVEKRNNPPYYSLPLDGSLYSARFTQTDGHLRIEYHSQTEMFHFFVSVMRECDGEIRRDWLELWPSPAWRKGMLFAGYSTPDSLVDAFHVTPLPRPGNQASQDFCVQRQNFVFSGAEGDAAVIKFDAESSKAGDFLFWSQGNYVPFWQINENCLFTYEFVETWAERGCYEPMSDRLNAYNNHAVIVEDTPARKVIRWEYGLVNPDYEYPLGQLTAPPMVTETYTIYPDGIGVRDIIYKPNKVDNWNELAEYILVAAEGTQPSDHVPETILTLTDLESHWQQYDAAALTLANGNPAAWKNETAKNIEQNWKRFAAIQHFSSGRDVFSVWPNDPLVSETYAFYPTNPSIDWHNIHYHMCHWPVNKTVYQEDFKSTNPWPGRLSAHSSTFGVEYWSSGESGDFWADHYQVDSRDGRMYRRWQSLIGMVESGSETLIRDAAFTWLYPQVEISGEGFCLIKTDYAERCIRIGCPPTGISVDVHIRVLSEKALYHPVLLLEGWKGDFVLEMGDAQLRAGMDYRTGAVHDGLVIWLNCQSTKLSITIRKV